MSTKLSSVPMFYVMMVGTLSTGTLTFTKVGKGIKVTDKRPSAKAKAMAQAQAEKLAKATPGARFYVMSTVSGHMKRPEVCSKSYN